MKPSQSGGQNIFTQQPRRSSNNSRNGMQSPTPSAPPYPEMFPERPPRSNASSSGYSGRSGSNASSTSPTSPTSPTQTNFNAQSSSSVPSRSGHASAATTTIPSPPPAATNDSYSISSDAKRKVKSDRPRNERKASKSRLHADHLVEASGSNVSGCECSDEEIITNFQKHYSRKNSVVMANSKCDDQEAGPSGSAGNSARTGLDSNNSRSPGVIDVDSSDASSFEDLGVSPAAAGPSIDAETWQIINQPPLEQATAAATEAATAVEAAAPIPTSPTVDLLSTPNDVDLPHPLPPNITCTLVNDHTIEITDQPAAFSQHGQTSTETADTFNPTMYSAIPKLKTNRKISRRRSDGIVYTSSSGATRHNLLDDDNEADSDADESSAGDRSPCESQRRPRKSCHKCGKTKGDIRKHIERFRKQLETTTNASEAEIKQQLEEFLSFLESRSRNSIDDGIDGGGADDALPPSDGIDSLTDGVTYGDDDDAYDEYGFDDDAGIHVYATFDRNPNDTSSNSTQPQRQFTNIGDFETL